MDGKPDEGRLDSLTLDRLSAHSHSGSTVSGANRQTRMAQPSEYVCERV